MPRRTFSPTERIGVNVVATTVTGFKWIWREQPADDFGVDGHIEVVGRGDSRQTIMFFTFPRTFLLGCFLDARCRKPMWI